MNTCFLVSITCLLSNFIGKSVINSVSKNFNGAKVPDVSNMLLGFNSVISENPTPGFKHQNERIKSKWELKIFPYKDEEYFLDPLYLYAHKDNMSLFYFELNHYYFLLYN